MSEKNNGGRGSEYHGPEDKIPEGLEEGIDGLLDKAKTSEAGKETPEKEMTELEFKVDQRVWMLRNNKGKKGSI
ncbi:MAG: hypothetical protein CMI53_04090 [Parcubacteria group bacterium]|jgi:hypothetical protein|nr:hypothetical protein [Parcubacteria group bacterium]|tara:strand:+ start:3316 stop:3537 length:222 start_codon:yes stop_codon:yes gene_type:complete